MSQYTCRVDHVQIIEIATLVPEEHARSLANQYLDLSDDELDRSVEPADIQEAPSCMVYRALRHGLWKDGRGPSVEDLKNLVNVADQSKLFDSNVWKCICSANCKDSESMTKQLVCRVCLTYTSFEEAEHFVSTFLQKDGICNEPKQQQLQHQAPQKWGHVSSEKVLLLWARKMGQEGNILNLSRMLKDIEKQDKHIISGSVTAILKTALALQTIMQLYQQPQDMILLGMDVISRTLAWHYRMRYKYIDTPYYCVEQNSKPLMDEYCVSLRVLQYDRQNGRNNHAQVGKSTFMELSHVFKNGLDAPSFNPFIVLEGNPGSGKTTFCQKLAWDWSQGLYTIQQLDSFDYIFYVDAFELKKDESLESYIHRVYFQHNSFIDIKQIVDTLKPFQSTLMLLDGFDQIPSLDNFINNVLVIGCSCVITCSPARLIDVPRNVDKTIMIEQLDAAQVHKLLKQKMSPKNSDSIYLLAYEHLSTHLMLSLYTQLDMKVDAVDTLTISNVSLLVDMCYSKLQKLVINTTSSTELDLNYLVSKMGELAFKYLVENKTILQGNFSKIEMTLGFLKLSQVQDLSSDSFRYTFKHKLLQEFLAARYIESMAERNTCGNSCNDMSNIDEMLQLTKQVSSCDSTHPEQTSMVPVFVSGFLSAAGKDASSFLMSLFQDWDSSKTKDASRDFVGHSRHLLLKCFGQCNSISLTHNFLKSFLKNDAKFWLDHAFCDSSCLRGFGILLESGAHNGLVVDVLHSFHTSNIENLDLLWSISAISPKCSLAVQPNCNFDVLLGETGICNKEIDMLQICSMPDVGPLNQQHKLPSVNKMQLKNMETAAALNCCHFYGNNARQISFHLIIDNEQTAEDITDIIHQRQYNNISPAQLVFYACPVWFLYGVVNHYFRNMVTLVIKSTTFAPGKLKEFIRMLSSNLVHLIQLFLTDIQCLDNMDESSANGQAGLSDEEILKLSYLCLNNCEVTILPALEGICKIMYNLHLCEYKCSPNDVKLLMMYLQGMPLIPAIEISNITFTRFPADIAVKVKTDKLKIWNCSSGECVWLMKHFVSSKIRLSEVTFSPERLSEAMQLLDARTELKKLRIEKITIAREKTLVSVPVRTVNCPMLDVRVENMNAHAVLQIMQHFSNIRNLQFSRVTFKHATVLSAVLQCCQDVAPLEDLSFSEVEYINYNKIASDCHYRDMEVETLTLIKCNSALVCHVLQTCQKPQVVQLCSNEYTLDQWAEIEMCLQTTKYSMVLYLGGIDVCITDEHRSKNTSTLSMTDFRVDNSSYNLVEHIMQRIQPNLKSLLVKSICMDDSELERFVSLVESCDHLAELGLYTCKDTALMVAMMKTEKLKHIVSFGIDWYNEEQFAVAKNIIREARSLMKLWLYNECEHAAVKAKTDEEMCEFLVSECYHLSCLQTGGMSADAIIHTLENIEEEGRNKLQWKIVELCDTLNERLTGGWEEKLRALGLQVADTQQDFSSTDPI